ncbi:MAG: hypothetical protein L0Z62_32845 [Gemmataceae bacterium]|nr:hypothetical protein [Gemmataceae bacterium]
MARDAIARQYDVDKNSVTLTSDENVKGGYRPGTISFQAKQGRTIDLEKLRASIAATRLSGGTRMSMDWLEITARGEVVPLDDALRLRVSGTGQEFVLIEDPGGKPVLPRLREALARGAKSLQLTGRVQGWNGRFPDVLKAVAPGARGQTVLLIRDFTLEAK